MSENAIIKSIAQTLEGMQPMVLASIGEGLTAEQTVFQMAPGGSHILWLAGHMAWSRDAMTNPILGGAPGLPEEYSTLFGMRSKASPDAAAYPALGQVLDGFRAAHQVTLAQLEEMGDARLAEPTPEGPVRELFPTVGALLAATPFHDGYHSGQITLLRRAQGLPSGLGF